MKRRVKEIYSPKSCAKVNKTWRYASTTSTHLPAQQVKPYGDFAFFQMHSEEPEYVQLHLYLETL
jgi:hypothetical protein